MIIFELLRSPRHSLEVVRFTLHRYFVQQHGWYVNGFDPLGDSWYASAPTLMLKGRVPSHVQALLDSTCMAEVAARKNLQFLLQPLMILSTVRQFSD